MVASIRVATTCTRARVQGATRLSIYPLGETRCGLTTINRVRKAGCTLCASGHCVQGRGVVERERLVPRQRSSSVWSETAAPARPSDSEAERGSVHALRQYRQATTLTTPHFGSQD